jgi:hypothetical protein
MGRGGSRNFFIKSSKNQAHTCQKALFCHHTSKVPNITEDPPRPARDQFALLSGPKCCRVFAASASSCCHPQTALPLLFSLFSFLTFGSWIASTGHEDREAAPALRLIIIKRNKRERKRKGKEYSFLRTSISCEDDRPSSSSSLFRLVKVSYSLVLFRNWERNEEYVSRIN